MICTCEKHDGNHEACRQASGIFVCVCSPLTAEQIESELERVKAERDGLRDELAAFKQALCQRGENPDTLTPQKAFEFIQGVYNAMAAVSIQMEELRRSLVECDSMLSLLRYRGERTIAWDTDGLPSIREVDSAISKARSLSEGSKP